MVKPEKSIMKSNDLKFIVEVHHEPREEVIQALNLAHCELISMYRKLGYENSNVLDLLGKVLVKLLSQSPLDITIQESSLSEMVEVDDEYQRFLANDQHAFFTDYLKHKGLKLIKYPQ